MKLLSFTEYGAAQLTERVIQALPSLAQYNYNVPVGPFTGTFNDSQNGEAILDSYGTGLIGSGDKLATIFGDIPLPRPFLGATLRLNFGAPNNSVLEVDEIRIIPSSANGGVIQGEWLLIPEPSSAELTSFALLGAATFPRRAPGAGRHCRLCPAV